MNNIKVNDCKSDNIDIVSTSSPEEDELIKSLRNWYIKIIILLS